MADYAGAVAAIKQRLRDNWATTRIEEANKTPDQPWPPVSDNGDPQPFLVIEVIVNASDIQGVGRPGGQMNIDYGHILVHVCVPTGSGTELAHSYASTIAAVYRSKEFYNATSGFAVRTWRPFTDNGASADIEGIPNGLYWKVVVSAEFEYLHID
jgi:hypothetical protein